MGVGSFVVPVGPEVIAVLPGGGATVKVREAGVESTLPDGSVARTSKV